MTVLRLLATANVICTKETGVYEKFTTIASTLDTRLSKLIVDTLGDESNIIVP